MKKTITETVKKVICPKCADIFYRTKEDLFEEEASRKGYIRCPLCEKKLELVYIAKINEFEVRAFEDES